MEPRFLPAQAALAAGDANRLRAILATNPGLAAEQSRISHPTLLQCLVLIMPPGDRLEELAEILVACGAELTDPLIAASSVANLRAIAKLLDFGADIEGNGRWSPLEEALYWNHADAVKLLLERGAKVKNLRIAAGLDDLQFMTRCFDTNGELTTDAGEVASPFDRNPISKDLRTDREQILGNALIYAAAWGRIDGLDFLLDRGASLDLIPSGFDYAGTALHYAALEGRREMVEHLLRRGADPSLLDTKIGNRPEDWAEYGGFSDLSEFLRRTRQAAV